MLIVLIIFTAPINCIVGGKNVTEADQHYFRHCVYITNNTETPPKIHFSGFIFDKKTIITAAHNVVDDPAVANYKIQSMNIENHTNVKSFTDY